MDRIRLVDTHCHICDAVFGGDRELVMKRAVNAGVAAIIAVGENMADAEKNLKLSESFPEIKPAAGLYPAHVDLAQADEMIAFIRAERKKLWAIGEVGLDHWVVKEPEALEIQKEIFSRFIELSLELDLPLNVHSRSAGRHAIELLLKKGAKKVQLHAFDGKASSALPAVEAGYFFSIPPSVVRSKQKQKLLKHLPLSSLLVETDSPVLGPEADVRNEPGNLVTAVTAISELKQVPVPELISILTENTKKLYGTL